MSAIREFCRGSGHESSHRFAGSNPLLTSRSMDLRCQPAAQIIRLKSAQLLPSEPINRHPAKGGRHSQSLLLSGIYFEQRKKGSKFSSKPPPPLVKPPPVGCVEDARKAIEAGVDAVIVQSRDAGGHVLGQEGLISLIPKTVDLAANRNIPVIAAGGVVDARGYVAALALGAHGVCLGTRFVATNESFAHTSYKKNLVEYEKTEYTNVFGRSRWPNAPHRVLETPFFNECRRLPDNENEENQPIIGHSTIHGKLKEIRLLAGTVPNATTTGDIESMVMYAGAGVMLIKEILPAAEVIKRLVLEAQQLITNISLGN